MAGNQRSTEPAGPPQVSRGDRVALTATQVGAALVAVLALAGIIYSGWSYLTNRTVRVTGMQLSSQSPEIAEWLPGITDSYYEAATIVVADPSPAARWLLWSEIAMSGVIVVGIGVIVTWLCRRLQDGKPFGRSVTVATASVAAVVAIGGTLSQVLGAYARSAVVEGLGPAAVGNAPELPDDVATFPTFALGLNLAPIGIGMALAVVALAFQIGDRLQRDTEGLV